ncbi:MAG: class II aldolase/adducin family protein [Myxococcota bacterium]
MPYHRLRQDVARYAQMLHERGWVANHDGNVSVRDAPGEFLCTPTAWSKRLVTPEDVLVVDMSGKVRSGRRKPFGEWHLHKAVYTARPDAMAVLHAHPPTATGFAVAGRSLGRPAIAEMVVSIGEEIPLLPFTPPRCDKGDETLRKAVEIHDAVVLANHGVITLGDDLEQAFLRMELVEHWARILLTATQLGGAVPLPGDDVKKLLEARTKAGLGPQGRSPFKKA